MSSQPRRSPAPYRPDRARPTDEEIRALAVRIARAMAGPRPDDGRDDILAPAYELPPKDEDRVIAALADLRACR